MSQQHSINTVLDNWNRIEQQNAMEIILPCNGSRAWAIGVVKHCPFHSPEQLFAASDQVWGGLSQTDWQRAFDSHPRIGEHKAKAATSQSATWSQDEQSASQSGASTAAELAAANREYEAKFGRIFIVCATGKTAAQMLALLRERLHNEPAAELLEAAEQQRRITQLRLRKWLELPAATCEEV